MSEPSDRSVGTPLIHDNNVATHLYRITQEAFNNAVRHGDADRVRIVLAAADGKIRLHMRDDGVGFDQKDNDGSGMGVRIMNYRARIVGGTLEISSSRGEGTIVTCTVPRTGSGADAANLKSPGSAE